jgi:hypothetical protein
VYIDRVSRLVHFPTTRLTSRRARDIVRRFREARREQLADDLIPLEYNTALLDEICGELPDWMLL